MNWKEISVEEAEKHPAYGFGGGLYLMYAAVILWTLHSLYIVFLDADYALTMSYGYENFTMADFTCFIQFLVSLPFLYLAPKLHPQMPSIALSMFSVNLVIWFTFGMLVPSALGISIVVTLLSVGMILYLNLSERVNVTYRNRVKA
tara:strand:+ start:273 stop:710 length:438 start_codon:yes stop_codon:yes gene_type:complete